MVLIYRKIVNFITGVELCREMLQYLSSANQNKFLYVNINNIF